MPIPLLCQGIHSFFIPEEPFMKLTNNVELLFEDEHILVCKKPPGLATQTQATRNPDMVTVLKRYLYSKNPTLGEPYLAVIHRLDQPVGGLLVFGKTSTAAKNLSAQMQSRDFGKHYATLLSAAPNPTIGTWEHFMIKDATTNTSKICSKDTPGSKRARLHYELIEKPSKHDMAIFSHITENTSDMYFVRITLETGRHHQIRVQASAMNCAIMGDTKYGDIVEAHTWNHIALCAYKLSFNHPITQKHMQFMI